MADVVICHEIWDMYAIVEFGVFDRTTCPVPDAHVLCFFLAVIDRSLANLLCVNVCIWRAMLPLTSFPEPMH